MWIYDSGMDARDEVRKSGDLVTAADSTLAKVVEPGWGVLRT